MAIILVTPEFLSELLFPGELVRIDSVSMSNQNMIALEITGDSVPDVEQVNCIIHSERTRFEFLPVE